MPSFIRPRRCAWAMTAITASYLALRLHRRRITQFLGQFGAAGNGFAVPAHGALRIHIDPDHHRVGLFRRGGVHWHV